MTSCKESPMGQKLFAQKSGHEPNLWEFRTWENREFDDNILITWHQSRRRCLNNVLMQTCICMIDITVPYISLSLQTGLIVKPCSFSSQGDPKDIIVNFARDVIVEHKAHLQYISMQPCKFEKHQKININRYFTWIAHYMHLISQIY